MIGNFSYVYGLTYFGYYIKAKVSYTPVDFHNSSLHTHNFQNALPFTWQSTCRGSGQQEEELITTKVEFLAPSYLFSLCLLLFVFLLFSFVPLSFWSVWNALLRDEKHAQHVLKKIVICCRHIAQGEEGGIGAGANGNQIRHVLC